MKFVDNILDKITIYRLMLYFLIALSVVGLFLMPPVKFILALVFLIGVSCLTNKIFSKLFKAPTNLESVYISALILFLVVDPTINLIWLAIISQASKYLLTINRKHIFNAVAISLVVVGYASWWIVIPVTVPFF